MVEDELFLQEVSEQKLDRLRLNAQREVYFTINMMAVNLEETPVDSSWMDNAKLTRTLLRMAITEDYADLRGTFSQFESQRIIDRLRIFHDHNLVSSDLIISKEEQHKMEEFLAEIQSYDYQRDYMGFSS